MSSKSNALDMSLDDFASSRSKPRRDHRNFKRSTPYNRPSQSHRSSHREQSESSWKRDRHEREEESMVFTVKNTSSSRKCRLRISNLHWDVTKQDLETLLRDFNGVGSVKLFYDNAGRSDGVAEVDFDDEHEAKRVIKEFDGVPLDGMPMNVVMVEVKERKPEPTRRIVSVGSSHTSHSSHLSHREKKETVMNRLGKLPVSERVGKGNVLSRVGNRVDRPNTRGRGKGSSRSDRGGGPMRRKPLSAEDLDADLDSYLIAGDETTKLIKAAEEEEKTIRFESRKVVNYDEVDVPVGGSDNVAPGPVDEEME